MKLERAWKEKGYKLARADFPRAQEMSELVGPDLERAIAQFAALKFQSGSVRESGCTRFEKVVEQVRAIRIRCRILQSRRRHRLFRSRRNGIGLDWHPTR